MKFAAIALVLGVAASSVLAADAPAPAPAARIFSSTTSSGGQPIVLPQGPIEVNVSVAEIPAGGATPVHKHPFPRYDYVLSGRVELTNIETDAKQVFEAGQFLIDPIGRWHQGRALDNRPVKLLIIDQTPPGQSNMVLRDAPSAATPK